MSYDVESNSYKSTYLVYAIEKLKGFLDSLISFYTSDIYKKFSLEISKIATNGSAYLAKVELPLAITAIIFLFTRSAIIKDLIDCILMYIEEGNKEALLKFDFTPNYLTKYITDKN